MMVDDNMAHISICNVENYINVPYFFKNEQYNKNNYYCFKPTVNHIVHLYGQQISFDFM